MSAKHLQTGIHLLKPGSFASIVLSFDTKLEFFEIVKNDLVVLLGGVHDSDNTTSFVDATRTNQMTGTRLSQFQEGDSKNENDRTNLSGRKKIPESRMRPQTN